jgi:hypothetical protein
MLNILRIFAILVSFTVTHALGAKITVVGVTATGFGVNETDAIKNAIINGISQVNGESVASKIKISKSTVSSTDSKTQSSRSIESEIEQSTRGVVKSWKKVSAVTTNQSSTATVSVQVFVQEKSDQLKRIKLAVVPQSQNQDDLTSILISGLSHNLTSTRKFAIIDRKNNSAINSEIENIKKNNGAIEDQARLNSSLAPDFIAVTNINVMQNKNNIDVLEATLEIIDYSTRQVKFSEKKTSKLKSADSANINKQVNFLAKSLTRIIVETLYPPLIVGYENTENLITISQGSDFFSVGDKCVIKEIKKPIRDPYTKEFLSFEKNDVGTAEITYVDKRISVAKVTSSPEFNMEKISSKKYEVWRSGQSSINLFKDALTTIGDSLDSKADPNDSDY